MKTPASVLVKQIKDIREAKTFHARSSALPTWCPGCGYFGIQHALNSAIQGLELPLHKCVIVSGIGVPAAIPFLRRLTDCIPCMAALYRSPRG